MLEHVPDNWIVVVEQPEGDCYATIGARGDDEKRELLVEL